MGMKKKVGEFVWRDHPSQNADTVMRQTIAIMKKTFGMTKPTIKRCGTCRWFQDMHRHKDPWGECREPRRFKERTAYETQHKKVIACCLYESRDTK